MLPIPDRQTIGASTYDARDPEARFPPIRPLRPPAGAPNVIVILIDDVGFGASSAFGGPCAVPTLEKLANNGLKYNRFHTTALCSPTRAALLTGRNHHTVNMGGITEAATSTPGQTSVRPNTCATFVETLRLNGYSTAQFGKCHEVPVWETSPVGPFDRWPTGSGFEYFYGFLGGETNQYYPALYEGTAPVEPAKRPDEGYHLSEDLAEKAVQWIYRQQSLAPDKPFFVYFAPGATHAPHHVPPAWADKYQGKFDQGWDELREQTLARQRELGVVPPECELTKRHDGISAWADVDPELKPVLVREMEIYAGFLEHTDHQIGKVVDALRDLEILEDTLLFVVIGDNGASAEGSMQGTFNEMLPLTGVGNVETVEFLRAHIDRFGGPEAYNHYAVGWAHAMNTPYQWTKQVASHFGGTRTGMIVHWPRGFAGRGELRSQFSHVIDIAPTVLEVAKLPPPLFVHGVAQRPLEGVSLVPTFAAADASEVHETQYFEMLGNRGIYHKGWTAVTKHRDPWDTGSVALPAFDADVWELYDTRSDWSQARDLAASQPDVLRTLQRLWLIEAVKYNVLPLDDRGAERTSPELAGRPQLAHGSRQVLYGGTTRLTEGSVINIKNKSHAITAEIEVPSAPAEGVIIAQGGITGGWCLYVIAGRLKYCYNYYGVRQYYIEACVPLALGKHQLRMEFDYDGGGLGFGGTVKLFVDGDNVGTGRVEKTEAYLFSADETCDIGIEYGSPVTRDYATDHGFRFNGEIGWVEIDIGASAVDLDHLITPEERWRVAMAIQ